MKRETLRGALRDELVTAIIDGEMRAGDRIPLTETAEGLGVSVTPLRESLVQLEREGLVQALPRRGYVVAPLLLSEVEDLYPLIAALECLALKLFPPTPQTLRAARKLNRAFSSCRGGVEAHRLDGEWHATLLRDCGNRLLLEILAGLKSRAARYEIAYLHEVGRIESSGLQHEEILDFLEEGDGASAGRVLRGNWEYATATLRPWLTDRSAQKLEPVR